MFSFMKIATFAALAFGVFTSAMPTVVESRDIEARQVTTLTSTLTNGATTLQEPCAKLTGLTAAAVTVEVVTEIVAEIVVGINAITTSCKGLPSGAIGTGDILALLSIIIKLVITSCGTVYNLPGVDQGAIIGCFLPIGTALVALINIVLSLVLGLLGGILSIVIGVLVGLLGGSCTTIIVQLKLTALISLLGL
ncbi:hypothetical protein OF83DRAFT_246546 [Amylostereum chailletii]|nr:hypothetical protein OF83DRAFT_246546 [Amylostereum chailletii]